MKGILIVGGLLTGILIFLSNTDGITQAEIRIENPKIVKKWMKHHGTNSTYIDWKIGKWVFKRDGQICLLIPKGGDYGKSITHDPKGIGVLRPIYKSRSLDQSYFYNKSQKLE